MKSVTLALNFDFNEAFFNNVGVNMIHDYKFGIDIKKFDFNSIILVQLKIPVMIFLRSSVS